MSRCAKWSLFVVLLLVVGLSFAPAAVGVEDSRPRVVLMLDPELDDSNTLVRYLLYSNMFDTEGLVYTSSGVHWKGDGQGTPWFVPGRQYDRPGLNLGPMPSWRWKEGEQFIHDAVEIYAEVYPNLKVHASGYPHPDELRSKIFFGNVEFDGDISRNTPGSNLIKTLLLDDDPRPVYLLTGAGHSTIGRALKAICEEFSHKPEWSEIYEKVSRKAIIQAFGDQDNVYANYIKPNWPDITYLNMSATIWGYFARRAVLPEDRHYLSAAWMRENVSRVGPFGEFYRVWGDGKQMVPGDIFDYFGFAGLNREQLTALGYVVWTDPQEAGSWISEGDTPIFMNLLDNGLRAHVDPTWGGWGGRAGEDMDPSGTLSRNHTAARWFGAAQRDFAARMRWTVTSQYEGANHNPIVEVLLPDALDIEARPGETVVLKGSAVDPDGDHITGRWWQYVEAGTYPNAVELTNLAEPKPAPVLTVPAKVVPGSPEIADVIESEIEVTYQFVVPQDAEDGQTLHFILEVQDNGTPSLTAYQRVVVTVVN